MSTLKTNNIQHVDRSDPSIIINTDGSVNIAGTMTYEDVTNVDAVGIITGRSNIDAQKQVHVGTGVSVKAGGINVTAGITTVQVLQATTGTFSSTISVAGNAAFTNNIDLNSDLHKIKIGAGDDFQLYHNGSNNFIFTNNGDIRIDTTDSANITLSTNGSERMRIDSSGLMGLGTNSPSSFYTHAKNLVIGSGSGGEGLTIYSGSSDSGYIGFNDTASNGMQGFIQYNHNGDYMAFGPNGTEKLRITSAGDVGIGVNDPDAKLEVLEDIYVKGSSGDGSVGIQIRSGSSALSNQHQIRTGGGVGQQLFIEALGASSAIVTKVAGSERLRIDANGRVITGHDTALTLFHGPYGTNKRNPHIQVNGTTVNTASMSLTSWDDNVVGYYGPAIFLAKSGSSTIGTNSRLNNLNSILGSIIFSGDDGDEFIKGAMIQGAVDASTGGNDMPGRLMFLTTADGAQEPTERLRITSSGQLRAGDEASSDRTSFRHQLSTTANASACLSLQNPTNSDGQGVVLGFFARNTNNAATKFADITMIADETQANSTQKGSLLFKTNVGASVGTRFMVNSSGQTIFGGNSGVGGGQGGVRLQNPDVGTCRFGSTNSGQLTYVQFINGSSIIGSISGNNSTAFNTSSDYRLKENETAITDGITRLKQLKPYRFNWKSDSSTIVDGFFAHEVSSIVPESITGTKDATAVEDDVNKGLAESIGDPIYQNIDHSKLVPLLTAALQEEVAKREELEARVASLESAIRN